VPSPSSPWLVNTPPTAPSFDSPSVNTDADPHVASTAADIAGYHPGPIFAPLPVVARGDSECSELPKLCTDPVALYGAMTTLTYLCPEKTNGLITVTVTTTGTTTVTEVPTDAMFTRTTTVTEVPTDDIFAPSSSAYVLKRYLALLFADLAGLLSVSPRSLRPPFQ
jgi:hypothetical protein